MTRFVVDGDTPYRNSKRAAGYGPIKSDQGVKNLPHRQTNFSDIGNTNGLLSGTLRAAFHLVSWEGFLTLLVNCHRVLPITDESEWLARWEHLTPGFSRLLSGAGVVFFILDRTARPCDRAGFVPDTVSYRRKKRRRPMTRFAVDGGKSDRNSKQGGGLRPIKSDQDIKNLPKG